MQSRMFLHFVRDNFARLSFEQESATKDDLDWDAALEAVRNTAEYRRIDDALLVGSLNPSVDITHAPGEMLSETRVISAYVAAK